MAMTRLYDPTPRMTLPRALLSEALRLARSPLTAVHLVCGLAAGLACGEYFSVTRWDPALGADAYAQFLGALMPLMSAIVCGLAVDEERAAGRLANHTAVPSRRRAVAAKLLALAALGAGARAVALGVFGAVLAVAGRLPLGPAPLAAAWAGIVLGSLPLYALGLGVALRLGRNAAIGAGAAGMLLAFFSVGGLAHGLMTGELTGALATPLSWVPLAWPARLGSLGVEAFIAAARAYDNSLSVEVQCLDKHYIYGSSTRRDGFLAASGVTPIHTEADPPFPWMKIVVCAADDHVIESYDEVAPEKLEKFRLLMEYIDRFCREKCYATRSMPRLIEIGTNTCDKGTAARTLANTLGRKTLVCAGDAMNDLAMLREADIAFCPADCDPALRTLPFLRMVRPCSEGAVADAIRALDEARS